MKKYISILAVVMSVMTITITGCQSKDKATRKLVAKTTTILKKQDHEIVDNFYGKSLKNNMLREETNRDLVVYLPPSYYTSNKRYPVVYFLHGFQEGPNLTSTYSDSFDKQMKGNKNKEFIIVEPDADSVLQGSFYVNSPVTGNWEDYIVKDVVNYVDKKYRTIHNKASRGIAGFSMGGFGALNIALKHPDIFSSAYILSPGAFDKNGLRNAMSTWDSTFLQAYGAAFSPNVKGKYPYANIPKFNNTVADNKIVQNWENGFGNLKGKIDNYKKLKQHLSAIKIEYGTVDSYNWIMQGTAYFSKLLNDAGIKHECMTFFGGHEVDPDFAKSRFIDFFSKNLKRK